MRRMDKPRSFAPIIAAVLLLLPLLYVGSYLAMVVPKGIVVSAPTNAGYFVYHYRGHGEFGERTAWPARLFWPLEQIDRRLRPQDWEPSQRESQLIFDRTGERIGVDFGP